MTRGKKFSMVVVMGDFNMPDIDWNESGSPVLVNVSSPSATVSDAISSSDFIQLVTGKTFTNYV